MFSALLDGLDKPDQLVDKPHLKRLGHQVKGHNVRLPAGATQGLLEHSLPLASLSPAG